MEQNLDKNANVDLPTEQARKALFTIIKDEFKLFNYSLEITPGSTKGDNYIGVVYRVKVKCATSPEMNLGFIVKMPPQNPARREQFFARPCFLREIAVYEELLPLFKKIQQEAKISIDFDGFDNTPKCYRCLKEEFTEALFLEDLKLSGFEMYDRRSELTFEQAEKAVDALAKFHAVSFVAKERYWEHIESFTKWEDIFWQRRQDPGLLEFFKVMTGRALGTLDKEKDMNIIEPLKKLLQIPYMDHLKKIVHSNSAEPYAIMCHGDYWNNNILYKYDKDGKPIDVKILDFQISRYASPVTDLVYFIFCCTSGDFRKKYYEQILIAYYNSLESLIRRLGSDPNKLFPYSAFKTHLKQFGFFGFLMALMVLQVFVAPSDEIPDMDEVSQKMAKGEFDKKAIEEMDKQQSKSTQDTYAKRMRDVIIDQVKLGMIDLTKCQL